MSNDNGHPDGDYEIVWVEGQPPDEVLDCGCWVRYTAPDDDDGITTAVTACRVACPNYQRLIRAMQSVGTVEFPPMP